MPADAGIQSRRHPRSDIECLVKVSPIRIDALDQVELPSPLPFLELLFPSNRLVDIGVVLVPDEPCDRVFRGELRTVAAAMLKSARGEMVRHPNVKRPIAPTRHDVDAVAAFGHRSS